MPLTGSLDTTKFTKGRGLIYLDTGVPGVGGTTVLTGGVPADGVMLGYTPEGNTINVGFEQEDVNVDEASSPVETIVTNETLSIAGAAMQIEDFEVMERIIPTGTNGTGTGVEKMNFGGKVALTSILGMLLVWNSKSVPGKFVYFSLYDPINTAGTSFQVTKTGYGQASYTFLGRAIGSRAAGDQIGSLIKETV